MARSELLQTALEAAAAAADIITPYYQRNVRVDIKADRTPVTVADIEAEKIIRQIITRAYPEHGFYGEETGTSNTDAEYLWIVDPIDGTKGFIRNYPMFSTQIALMHEGRIRLGVSSAPMFAELVCAERGDGAWLNDQPIHVSDVATLEEGTVSTGNLRTLARSNRWPRLGELVSRVDRIRGYGDFYHYHLLASGCIDIVIETDVKIFDVAALSVIVEEAGGTFTDLEGKKLDLATTSVLATNTKLHEPVLGLLG